MLISYLFTNPLVFLLVAVSLIISISIHEFSHAYVADKLGDPTARYLGRVTLNPKAHLDPLGTILLLFAGFGWGRPVPVNSINFSNPKRDMALVSLAGPLSNFILAILLSIALKFIGSFSFFGIFLYLVILYNLMLGIFNILPFHPLDGFKIVSGVLPSNLAIQWEQVRPYGMYILMFLVFTRSLGRIIDPLMTFFMRILGL